MFIKILRVWWTNLDRVVVEVGFSLLLESAFFFFFGKLYNIKLKEYFVQLVKKKQKVDSNNKGNPTSTTILS